ncbi:pilus assembly protein TadG-related protein [Sphingomicrobium lutaoense]|uniref:Flp pilus assembly protein TadG n=1 Tax=Sphingomicrobium lutaoense TaxID=515949 RepID=A0A839YUW6_9SPHN|nr:pilus assembly protein TadG-related protein [Sphingomicrobium lutaoense]MBB3764021.1 Flp pilus assembly protein TadG [Sphingomicrobium lutaoense]
MLKAFKSLLNDKRGNVLVIVGASMPLLVGSAGLATDTIQWVTWKRQLQRAADSAAFAGVYADMQGQDIPLAIDKDITHNNTTGIALLSAPSISYPADTATYQNAVQVELEIQKRLSFSSLFLADPPVIRASATAAVVPTGEYCVVSLENTPTTGITATGSSSLSLGCGMITNSTSLDAAVAKGSSSVTASPIAAVGGIDTTGNWGSGTDFLPFTVAQEDPFESVTANPPWSCANGKLSVKPGVTVTVTNDSSDPTKNCYTAMDIKGEVNFEPGVYYISGGDFTANSSADINAPNGVTFVMTNVSSGPLAPIGNVDFNGSAEITIEAPDTGPFKGIAIYQDRRATSTASASASSPNKINGNSDSHFRGAFYFPKQQVTFTGTAGMSTACVQMVARRVYFSGNSAISNSCPAGSGSGAFKGRHVRLVG